MTSFFTLAEGSILIRLLIAHFLTDFILQPNKWIEGKKRKNWVSVHLLYHVCLTGAVAWLLLWNSQLWWPILLIMITHYVIDGAKTSAGKRVGKKGHWDLVLFLTDQALHILVIVLVWLWIIGGWHKMNVLLQTVLPSYWLLLRLLGYLIMVGPVGYIIQFLTKKWTNELNPSDSLKDAGKWIGILERVLTLTFVYINQFSAIGFLIAAKSILRVIDKPDKPSSEPTLIKPFSSRKHTEYVVIGTFLSFSIAILTGLVINWLLTFK